MHEYPKKGYSYLCKSGYINEYYFSNKIYKCKETYYLQGEIGSPVRWDQQHSWHFKKNFSLVGNKRKSKQVHDKDYRKS